MSPREYRDRLAFEHELINRRLTWLLTSQALLFAAYGFALKGDETEGKALFLKAVPTSGAIIASLILVGVVAGLLAKTFVWIDYRAQEDGTREPFGVRTWITVVAFLPDVLLPIVFVVAWKSLYDIPTSQSSPPARSNRHFHRNSRRDLLVG
jgi:hypothetical protein